MSTFRDNKKEYFELHKNSNYINNYYEVYNKIEKIEIEKNKDLSEFTKDDICEITGKKKKSKYKNVTEDFIYGYRQWKKETINELKAEKKKAKLQKRMKMKEEINNRKKEQEIKMQKYLNQKEVFFKEFYNDTKKATVDTYRACYITNIVPLEIYKQKDLYDFNDDDVLEIFESMSTIAINVKRMVRNLINAYFQWADEKGLVITHTNPLDSHSAEELFSLNIKAFKKQFMSLEEVYELCEKAIKTGQCSYQDVIVVLLARYGIVGKAYSSMINLKWEDINRDLLKINIVNESTGELQELDIDDRLFYWLDKAKECCYFEKKYIAYKKNNEGTSTKVEKCREYSYIDYGYVVKVVDSPRRHESEQVVKDTRIKASISKVRESCGINKLDVSILTTAREFDMINKIKDIKGILYSKDFSYVHKLYFPESTYSSYFNLLEKYRLYYEDAVIDKNPFVEKEGYMKQLENELAMAKFTNDDKDNDLD